MRCRKAFTLIELMVVIAIIAALAAILVPVVAGLIEKARFVRCGANLNTMGKSLKMYDINQSGEFPTLARRGDTSMLPPTPEVVNTVPPNDGSNGDPPTATNDWTDQGRMALGLWPMQQIWPLIVTGRVSASAFHCQGDAGWKPRQSTLTYGWTALTDVSYGVQFPFEGYISGTTLVQNKGWPGSKTRQDRLVVMADRNPGGSVTSGMPHSNHPDIGCNAVDAGGNVVQYDFPGDSKCGMNSNDIYADNSASGRYFPRGTDDTVITPLKSR